MPVYILLGRKSAAFVRYYGGRCKVIFGLWTWIWWEPAELHLPTRAHSSAHFLVGNGWKTSVLEKGQVSCPQRWCRRDSLDKKMCEVSSNSDLGIGGNSLVVQWLGLCASIAGSTGSIPGRGAKILQATRPKKKKKRFVGWYVSFPTESSWGPPESYTWVRFD